MHCIIILLIYILPLSYSLSITCPSSHQIMSYSNSHRRNHRDTGNRRRTRLPGRSAQSDHHHNATNNDGEDDGWEQVSNQRPSQRRNRQQQSSVQHRRGQAQSQFMMVLCGLPGSGKFFISLHQSYFLTWQVTHALTGLCALHRQEYLCYISSIFET